MTGYWDDRKDLEYYAVVRRWLDELGECESILDVGPLDTPVSTWGRFLRRYTIDPKPRPELPGVHAIVGTWPDDWGAIWGRVSVITCLQVVEHVENPAEFCRSILTAADVVVLSVPWRWPAGACECHRHDPIDGATMLAWTGRQPDRLHETKGRNPRGIFFFQ